MPLPTVAIVGRPNVGKSTLFNRLVGKNPVVVVANKAESRAGEAGVLDAYRLGLGNPVPLSAEHGEGVADLFEALQPLIEVEAEEDEEEEQEEDEAGAPLKLAIVGRPNAGKSTL